MGSIAGVLVCAGCWLAGREGPYGMLVGGPLLPDGRIGEPPREPPIRKNEVGGRIPPAWLDIGGGGLRGRGLARVGVLVRITPILGEGRLLVAE